MKIIYVYIAVVLILVGYWMYRKTEVVHPPEMVLVTLYVQNKREAAKADCSVTQKKTIEIEKPVDVIDSIARILFEDELKAYGQYKAISVADGIAKITLANEVAGLSSCQIGHITSVLGDTLTQYPTISSVELYSPSGKVEF